MLRVERCEGSTAFVRIRTPSRCRASRASCRWCDVRVLVESSVGESVMLVMVGVEREGGGSESAYVVETIVGMVGSVSLSTTGV